MPSYGNLNAKINDSSHSYNCGQTMITFPNSSRRTQVRKPRPLCAYLGIQPPLSRVCWGIAYVTAFHCLGSQCEGAESGPLPPVKTPHRFSIGYQSLWNVRARFSHSPSFASGINPGPASGGQLARNYDDGFIGVDNTGNAGDVTTFWGYNNGSQVPGNDTLVLSATVADASLYDSSVKSDPQHGLEVRYQGTLGSFRSGGTFGLESAFSFSLVELKDGAPRSGQALRISDAFGLNGIVPPSSPYSGPFGGPGPLISSAPSSRTVTPLAGGGSLSGYRELDAELFGLRVGPYVEWPLREKLNLAFSGGLAIGIINGSFKVNETLVLSGAGTSRFQGQGQEVDAVVGGYINCSLTYQLSSRWHLFSSFQYMSLSEVDQALGERKAVLDLNTVIGWTTGLGYQF